MSRVFAIVLAGGSGTRMHSEIPKQYMDLQGDPVILHSIRAFAGKVDQAILVAKEHEWDYLNRFVVPRAGVPVTLADAGRERYDSVLSGLEKLKRFDALDTDLILIHDGARPLVTGEIIERCIEDAKEHGACVAAMPVKDTIKVASASGYAVETPDRSTLWQIQTPQAFRIGLIKESYKRMKEDPSFKAGMLNITDDAMVVENFSSVRVKLTMGSYENMKITTPEDIEIARFFIDKVK